VNKLFKVTVTDDKQEMYIDYISLEDLEIEEIDWFFLSIEDRENALLRKMWELHDFNEYNDISYQEVYK
jgi:hypothetical protein